MRFWCELAKMHDFHDLSFRSCWNCAELFPKIVCELIQTCRSIVYQRSELQQPLDVKLQKKGIFRQTCVFRNSRFTFHVSLRSIYFWTFERLYIDSLVQTTKNKHLLAWNFAKAWRFWGNLVYCNIRLTVNCFPLWFWCWRY